MLARTLVALSVVVALGVIACSDDDTGSPEGGSGGGRNTGGATESGGSSGSGGAKSSGGSQSSGGATESGGTPASGGASAESGGASGSGGSDEPDGSPPAEGGVVDGSPPDAPTCALVSQACGILDAPNQPQALRDCAALGGSDEATCQAQLEGCRTLCAKTLCNRLGSYCHEPDPGDGPLHECHEFNHRGSAQGASEEDVAWCFDEAPRCYQLCKEARGD